MGNTFVTWKKQQKQKNKKTRKFTGPRKKTRKFTGPRVMEKQQKTKKTVMYHL